MGSELTKEDLVFDEPSDGSHLLVLAHGAGAGLRSEFMETIARDVSSNAITVCRFEFDYMRKRYREGGKGAPDSQKKLIATWKRAIELVDRDRWSSLSIGGKSMGGRIASMIASDVSADKLICLGYPFHPPGRPEKLRTEHLRLLDTPCLIIQGERDPFGTPADVETYELSSTIRLLWLPDGDHSFKPRKKSGSTLAGNLAMAVDAIAAFIRSET